MSYSQLELNEKQPLIILLLLSTRDDVMPIMEELLYMMTGRDGGPMRLSDQDAAQQAEEFLKQPELCERVRRYIAGQAGDGLPVVLPWEKANVGKGPQNQVCIKLLVCTR